MPDAAKAGAQDRPGSESRTEGRSMWRRMDPESKTESLPTTTITRAHNRR